MKGEETMLAWVIGFIAVWIVLIGPSCLLSWQDRHPDPRPDAPEHYPLGAIPVSLETAERMIELAYTCGPSRRASRGESHFPSVEERADELSE
jgi:hypothetical protein